MPEIRNRLSLAVVEVDDVLAKKLIDSELWDAVDAPAARKRAPRKAAAVVEVESGE